MCKVAGSGVTVKAGGMNFFARFEVVAEMMGREIYGVEKSNTD